MYAHKNGICLRKVERRDLHLLMALKQESWFGTHRIAIVNSADQEDWFDRSRQSTECLYLLAFDKVTPVGVYKLSAIDWINRSANSAHDVFAAQRGKGYGRTVLEAGVDFAFEVLNLQRLDTEVLVNNLASLKTAEYAGYVREGLRRRAVHKCGEWLDSIFYGLLRDEWTRLPRVLSYGGCCNLTYRPLDGRDAVTSPVERDMKPAMASCRIGAVE